MVTGFVAGVIVFLWGALAHMALPLGTAGLRSVPDDTALLAAMRSTMQEPGMYFFPTADLSRTMSEEEEAAWNKRNLAGPAALVAFQPHGTGFGPKPLLIQAATDIAAAMIAAMLLAHVAASVGYGRRVLLAGSLGVFATLVVNVPYWNWYGFDATFTAAALVESTVGWLLAGLWLGRSCKACEP